VLGLDLPSLLIGVVLGLWVAIALISGRERWLRWQDRRSRAER
jgi:hypothetical protein